MANNYFHSTNPFLSSNPFVNHSTNPFVGHSTNPFVTHSTNPFVDEANLSTRGIARVRDDVEAQPVVLDPSNFDPSNFDFQGYFEAFCAPDSVGNKVQQIERIEPELPRNSSSFCVDRPRPSPRPSVRSRPIPRPRHSTALPVCQETTGHSESSDTLHPALRDCSIVPEVDSYSSRGRSNDEMLATLVNQFTEAVKDIKHGASSSAANSSRPELRPPRFDGNSDVHLFLKQFADVRMLNNWDDKVALVQLRNSLEKGAKDCGRADTLSRVYDRLLSMFGLSATEARERLHNLKRDANETYVSLGNRVERLAKLAYGQFDSATEMQLSLEHFDRALTDAALRQHLLVVRPRTLDEAVRAAQQFALVDRTRGRDAHVRVVQGNSSCTSVSSTAVVESTNLFPDAKVEALLESMTSKLESLSTRLSAVESSNKANQKTSKQGCFKCGDLSHFRKDCPLLQQLKEAKKTGSTILTSENC